MNELKIFENEEFGQVRTIVINKRAVVCGKRCGNGVRVCKS